MNEHNLIMLDNPIIEENQNPQCGKYNCHGFDKWRKCMKLNPDEEQEEKQNHGEPVSNDETKKCKEFKSCWKRKMFRKMMKNRFYCPCVRRFLKKFHCMKRYRRQMIRPCKFGIFPGDGMQMNFRMAHCGMLMAKLWKHKIHSYNRMPFYGGMHMNRIMHPYDRMQMNCGMSIDKPWKCRMHPYNEMQMNFGMLPYCKMQLNRKISHCGMAMCKSRKCRMHHYGEISPYDEIHMNWEMFPYGGMQMNRKMPHCGIQMCKPWKCRMHPYNEMQMNWRMSPYDGTEMNRNISSYRMPMNKSWKCRMYPYDEIQMNYGMFPCRISHCKAMRKSNKCCISCGMSHDIPYSKRMKCCIPYKMSMHKQRKCRIPMNYGQQFCNY
jgi:hypothetical protein